MNTILEQYNDKINGTFSFFDRMLIKGHIFQLFSLSGRNFFLSSLDVLLKDFPAYAGQVTSQIVSYVENMAVSQKQPIIYLTSAKIPKEQTALDVLKTNPVMEGCCGSCSSVPLPANVNTTIFTIRIRTSASCMSNSRLGSLS